MKIQLNFGYMDMEDVVADDLKCRKFVPHIESEFIEQPSGEVFVTLTSPYRYEIKLYVQRYLGDLFTLADSIIDENIVKD